MINKTKNSKNNNKTCDKEIDNKAVDSIVDLGENDTADNTDYTLSSDDITEDYAVIDPYEICEFSPDEIVSEVATKALTDTINIDDEETISERVHNMSVSLTKGKSGAIFLPFIALGIPFLIIAVGSFLILSPLTAIIWSLLSLSVYNLRLSPENKGGFKNFFKPITDKTLLLATAVYRTMTLFLTLLFFFPSLIVRLNFCMFPFILKDKREAGENPNIIDLFAESKELMIGHRREYLSLMVYSLLPIVLTILTLGIISIWSIPYLTALKANFYTVIKTKNITATLSNSQNAVND